MGREQRVNVPAWGQILPLGARGEVKNGPLYVCMYATQYVEICNTCHHLPTSSLDPILSDSPFLHP
jgi:hypothetical protein